VGQVTPRNSEMDFHEELCSMHTLTFKVNRRIFRPQWMHKGWCASE